MLRACHLPPIATPALCALRLSLIPSLHLSSPSNLHRATTLAPFQTSAPQTFTPTSPYRSPWSLKRVFPMHPCPKGAASFSAGSNSEGSREILVQHLLVKEDDQRLLLDLQQRVSGGEDLSDLAVEYSICPSKEEGGMLGWVRKGQMVPEFEEAAFNAPLNKVVRCKTKFGWHLLQVLSEREGSLLQDIQTEEFHAKMQDPNFLEEAQLIDVREPDEVARASLPGFQVFPLQQFGIWGPEITTKLDPQKDTYVMCHHGMRSLQVAKWLQTQGFKRIFNVSGGIHAYAVKADQSIPTY
nr:rhodanese-like/PpiC domain-containing protein 12, chloroplastic isoform X1 [Quercus suber]POE91086.1 rhodanese-like/ppic domain-containing protein 12, chloroplastic [Quercus suber]